MMRRKRRHAPYTTDDSRRRFPPPEAQPQPRIHPSDLIDDREAAQQREIEKLLQENRSLAGAHVSLNQELSAVQHELRLLSSTAATVKTERDAEVREVYDEARKKESDVRILDELRVELARVRNDIQNLVDDRKELTAKLQNMEKDLVKVGSELQQLPVIKAEIESMHNEVQRGRAAIDYEKKMHTSNLEYSQAMEKHKITLASEIEKLHAELANAEKRARAAAAAAAPSNLNRQISAATPNFTYSAKYGNPETGYGENLYPAPYAVHQLPLLLLSLSLVFPAEIEGCAGQKQREDQLRPASLFLSLLLFLSSCEDDLQRAADPAARISERRTANSGDGKNFPVFSFSGELIYLPRRPETAVLLCGAGDQSDLAGKVSKDHRNPTFSPTRFYLPFFSSFLL